MSWGGFILRANPDRFRKDRPYIKASKRFAPEKRGAEEKKSYLRNPPIPAAPKIGGVGGPRMKSNMRDPDFILPNRSEVRM